MLEPALMGNILDLSNLLVVFVMCHVPLAMIQQLLIALHASTDMSSSVEPADLASIPALSVNIWGHRLVSLVQLVARPVLEVVLIAITLEKNALFAITHTTLLSGVPHAFRHALMERL